MEYIRKNEWVELLITKEYEMTIENFLDRFNVSRKNKYLYFLNNEILVNNQKVTKDYLLKQNDRIQIMAFRNEEIDFKIQNIDLDVVYEDDFILIVKKKPNQLVHPDSKEGTNTLCNAVAFYYYKNQISSLVRYVHRIDYETSGLVMFCKSGFIQAKLDYMMAKKEIKREYIAYCDGKMNNEKGSIIEPIGRDRHNAKRFRVSSSGAYAKTNYICLQYNKMANMSVVKCDLDTGRTHQIRVHLSHLGNPILSDPLYGKSSCYINRLALHAFKLTFEHPITEKKEEIVIGLPKDMIF